MLRYFHEGKLYVIESRRSPVVKPEPKLQDMGQLRAIEYAWLCSSCCQDMTVYFDDEDRVGVVRRAIAHLTEQEPRSIATTEKDPARVAEAGRIAGIGACPMNEHELFSDWICEKQTHLAERELSSFVAAVTKMYGPEQARLSAQDWLDEFDLIDSPPLSKKSDWRAVTIAASARLAGRLNRARNNKLLVSHPTDTRFR
jgi:hypothetical protein